jgi:hypothetical protein
MSKIYATTMLVIFNNRIKISGGRFDQEQDEECALTATRLSRDQRRESRDSRTKIIVANGRLTFQLAEDLPSPTVPNSSTGSSSARNVCSKLTTYHGYHMLKIILLQSHIVETKVDPPES